jgi:S-DNA-T family DNA segregation ATPase FtsK/SpoIIIE
MDSRIVLDQKGAELLLGQGDMLFLTPSTTELRRAQGTLVTDQEIRKVTKFLRGVAQPTFERSLLTLRPAGHMEDLEAGERDPMFDEAVRIMIESGRGSVSLLQRRLGIGYSRASRLVDQMSLAGIVGDHKGSVAREVLITLDEWEQMKTMEDAAEASGEMFDDEDDAIPMIETTGEGVSVKSTEDDR